MAKYQSADKLLIAYDCIREEYARLNTRIGLSVNSREALPDQTTATTGIMDDFKYFDEDWKVFVATAKRRFGVEEVVQSLKHLGMDAEGDILRDPHPGT